MELRATSLNATRAGYRVDDTRSDKPTKSRGPAVAGTLSAALAGLVRRQDRTDGMPRGAMQVYSVRGVPPASPGDDNEFGRALEAAADKRIDTLLDGVDQGLSPADASAEADKALGKSDPQANFSAGLRHAGERIGVDGIALRGRDEPSRPDANIPGVHYGDRDTFGSAINATADKQADAYGQAAQDGASPSEAQDSANKAVGKIDPQANFSVRRSMSSSLAAALRLGRTHSERRPEAEQRRRPSLRPRIA